MYKYIICFVFYTVSLMSGVIYADSSAAGTHVFNRYIESQYKKHSEDMDKYLEARLGYNLELNGIFQERFGIDVMKEIIKEKPESAMDHLIVKYYDMRIIQLDYGTRLIAKVKADKKPNHEIDKVIVEYYGWDEKKLIELVIMRDVYKGLNELHKFDNLIKNNPHFNKRWPMQHYPSQLGDAIGSFQLRAPYLMRHADALSYKKHQLYNSQIVTELLGLMFKERLKVFGEENTVYFSGGRHANTRDWRGNIIQILVHTNLDLDGYAQDILQAL